MNTLKRTLLIIFLLGALGVCALLHPSFNGTNRYINYLHSLVYDDSLTVSCSDELDITKIKLVFENEMALLQNRNPEQAKRHTERNRSHKIIRVTIFEKGKQVADIPYDYGKQSISAYYESHKIGDIGHWRTNSYHVHHYNTRLTNENGHITLSGGIDGPDQMNNYVDNETK